MFDRFRFAPESEVKEHLKDMMVAHAAAGDVLKETQFHPEDREISVLTDFIQTDIFETTNQITENTAFRSAVKQFQKDLIIKTVQISEDFNLVLTVKELKKNKVWLDEQLSYLTRVRAKQIRLSQALREKLKPIED